jgi:SOS-response transcriptional repressor LexA
MNRVASDSLPVFTPRQGQYLAFIHAYTMVNGRPPAQADIQRFFQVTPPSVHQMLLTLERGGLISRRPGAPRSIAVLVDRSDLPALEPGYAEPVKITVTRYVPLHRGFDGLKFNGGLGGPRAQPEARCCARRPGSV